MQHHHVLVGDECRGTARLFLGLGHLRVVVEPRLFEAVARLGLHLALARFRLDVAPHGLGLHLPHTLDQRVDVVWVGDLACCRRRERITDIEPHILEFLFGGRQLALEAACPLAELAVVEPQHRADVATFERGAVSIPAARQQVVVAKRTEGAAVLVEPSLHRPDVVFVLLRVAKRLGRHQDVSNVVRVIVAHRNVGAVHQHGPFEGRENVNGIQARLEASQLFGPAGIVGATTVSTFLVASEHANH